MVRTTTSAEQNRNNIDAAYIDAHAVAIHYLDEIRARIYDMPAPETDGLNWAHVGDMNRIKSDLREIVEYLTGYSQPGN